MRVVSPHPGSSHGRALARVAPLRPGNSDRRKSGSLRIYRLRLALRRFLNPLDLRFRGFFFGTGVSAESSRGLVLDSDVDSTSRAGVVGVVGGTFVTGVVSLSCAGISDKSLTIDSKALIWHRWRCRSCSLSAAVGGVLRLVGSGVSWGGGTYI